jgi:hypothetical protein
MPKLAGLDRPEILHHVIILAANDELKTVDILQ